MIEKDCKEAFAKCKVFVDLGSGIGNVVFQVALQTEAKCYGVELMPIPAGYARDQLAEFKHRLTVLGCAADNAHLREGDFLEDPKIVKLIEKANIIYVNNYAFGSQVDHALANLFLGLKDSAKIISLKPFRPVDWRVTDWNVGEFASILRVERFGYLVLLCSCGAVMLMIARKKIWRRVRFMDIQCRRVLCTDRR